MTADNIAKVEEIDRKLAVVIGLLSYQIAGDMTIADGAQLLSRLGLSNSEIAGVFDSTPKAVSVRLSEAKSKKKKQAKKKA
ncbi:MAG: hypothetical protein IH991_13030 [Planctomycetes bacterium]|nr:hypothetical protein [Planctomycetota bacterium]